MCTQVKGLKEIRRNHFATSYSWTLSSNANSVLLILTFHPISTVTQLLTTIFTFSNVTGAHGGLYCCVYGTTGTTLELWVYMYGSCMYNIIIQHMSCM